MDRTSPIRSTRTGRPRRARGSLQSASEIDPAADRAAVVLWIGLLTLAALRAVATGFESMWAWGLNLHRFLAPGWAWIPWSIAAMLLIPAVGRRGSAALARLAGLLARPAWIAPAAAAVSAAFLVGSLPDRTRFVGDFLIRQGTVEYAVAPSRVWPQALPLDAWIHFRLPLWLTAHQWSDANGAARILGAVDAMALATLAVLFARGLELRREAAFAAGCVVFFGGTLGLFTGYGKAFVELAVLTAAIGVAGLSVVRTGRGLTALATAYAIALLLHRSALGFLPALLAAWALRPRAETDSKRERLVRWTAIAAPLLVTAAMLPRLIDIVRRFDPVHLAPAAGESWLAATVSGTRPIDSLNLLLFLTPLALLTPLLTLVIGRLRPRSRELAFLCALGAPFTIAIVVLHPVGGLARDYDDFATAGIALSMLAAWTIGMTLQRAQSLGWLAAATALAVAAPAVQCLVHNHDVERGLARAQALAEEPPSRAPAERARIYDFLGARWNQLERYEDSARAYRLGSVVAPSPRMLQQWAMAETMRGNLVAAVEAYHQQLAKEPGSVSGWMGLAAVASRIPDYEESRRALREVQKLDPNDPEVPALLEFLDRNEDEWKAGRTTTASP